MSSDLESVEIHEVLRNERRQMVLKFLRDSDGVISARELSERIAETESGESPPPSNLRRSVYISLHQTHLPKLHQMEIVDYDQSSKTVELKERGREVSVYMETVPRYGISWSEFYLGVSVLGLLLIIAGEIGVPILAAVGSSSLAAGTLLLLLAAAIYQTVSQRSSMLHRLRE